MPMRIRELAEHPLGLTWVVDDPLLRASHALAHDGRMWFVDPVDSAEAIERATALGEPAGVLQLFMAHPRDGEAIAKRLNIPHHVLPDVLPDSPFSVLDISLGPWKERALWWPEPKGLVVPESIGTATHYAVGRGPAGVHFLRRGLPPNRLRPFLPEHLLVGHGDPVHGGNAAAALLDALNRSRRDLPAFLWKAPGLLRGMQGRR
jgi:hypothetical protein